MPPFLNTIPTIKKRHYVMACEYARQGKSDLEIADELEVQPFVFLLWMKRDSDFRFAINKGRSQTPSALFKDLGRKQFCFLSAYMETGNLTQASVAAGVTRQAHYVWMKKEKYRNAFEEATQIATDALELEARRRAVGGVQKLKFHRGQAIMVRCDADDPEGHRVEFHGESYYVKPYVEHEYSDTLLIFMLKAKRPEQFGDKPISINNQNKLEFDLDRLLTLADDSTNKNVIDADYVKLEAQKIIESESDDND